MLLLFAFATLLGAHRPEGWHFSPCRDGSGFPPGTVAVFGGRTVDGGVLWILDASEHPALLSIAGRGASPDRRPLRNDEPLDASNSGLARARDGSLCALSASGRSLQCFDGRSGERVSLRPLPSRAQGVWSIAGSLGWAGFESRANRALVSIEKPDGFAPAAIVRSRGGPTSMETLTANLFACGLGTADRTPCWFLDSAELLDVAGNGPPARIALPPAARPARSYPVRDAAMTDRGVFWLLLNDPPSRPGALAGDGLRLLRLENASGGRAEVHPLPRPARAVLRADAEDALLLFRDGGAATCGGIAE